MLTSQTGIGLTLGQIFDGNEVAINCTGRDFNPAEHNCSETEPEMKPLRSLTE